MSGIKSAIRRSGHRGGDAVEQAGHVFFESVTRCIGDGEAGGTICVPGFFYDYARHSLPFDARTSPPDDVLGKFPNHFFVHAMTHRSLCPPVSIMACGRHAETVCATGTTYGHGAGSPWPRLIDLDAKMLFWGATPASMTFVHHVELLVGVPHVYNKAYPIEVKDMQGNLHPVAFNSVRYLDDRFEYDYDRDTMIRDMGACGILSHGEIFGIAFSLVGFKDACTFLSEKLVENPFYLLNGQPKFVPGDIPIDSAKIPLPEIYGG